MSCGSFIFAIRKSIRDVPPDMPGNSEYDPHRRAGALRLKPSPADAPGGARARALAGVEPLDPSAIDFTEPMPERNLPKLCPACDSKPQTITHERGAVTLTYECGA